MPPRKYVHTRRQIVRVRKGMREIFRSWMLKISKIRKRMIPTCIVYRSFLFCQNTVRYSLVKELIINTHLSRKSYRVWAFHQSS